MRVARAWIEGRELAAIEHEGQHFRVDVLDQLLGVPLPSDLLDRAAIFSTRVFGLKLGGLDDHAEAIAEGTRLDEARLDPSLTRLLPPVGGAPAVLELPPQGDSSLSVRINGRALLGHDSMGLLPLDDGPLWVAPAVAFIVGDELHLSSPEEATRSIIGRSLALAWSLVQDESQGQREGLGPSPGREVGTHLGPYLLLNPAFGLSTPSPRTYEDEDDDIDGEVELTLQPDGGRTLSTILRPSSERVARAMARASRFSDLSPGDVVLVTASRRLRVEPGHPVSLSAPGLGTLRGQIGG